MAQMIRLEISLTGHQAIGWPLIQLKFNDILLFDGEIIGQQTMDFLLDTKARNQLIIRHYGKTDSHVISNNDGTFVDRWCQVEKIKINGIDLGIDFLSDCNHPYHTEDGETIITNYLGKNGQLEIEFPMPMWEFWAECQLRSKWASLQH
jgi:hypothetical protein